MPSPQTLDIALDMEALLAPIPGENPAGKDLRYEGAYDEIKEARRADDALDQGEWKHEPKAADWQRVIAIATNALTVKGKDLHIAAWLVEALLKRHGFPGLRDGLRLLRELQERFWASLYPEVEDGDLELRTGPLEWLNEKLPLSIREVPVTQSKGGENYAWLHWQESRAVDNLGRQNPEAMAAAQADGKITGEQFDKAVAATSRASYEALFEELNQSREEYEQLDRVLEEKFGREAPSLLSIKKALEDCHALVEGIVKKKRELEPGPTPPEAERKPPGGLFARLRHRKEDLTAAEPGRKPQLSAHKDQNSPFSSTPLPGGVPLEPVDREDALRRLAAVAVYFRNTEPHSPVSYLVERAIQWGEMPLEEWLQDVISNQDVLSHVRETLGLKDSDANSTMS